MSGVSTRPLLSLFAFIFLHEGGVKEHEELTFLHVTKVDKLAHNLGKAIALQD